MIYDGHLTHVSVKLIEKAQEENVTIVKLPPHVTDKMQPLDVGCFGPWYKLLNERLNLLGPKETIQNDTFTDLLGEIWYDGLSPENVKAGFRATRIYPTDRSKFPHRIIRR